MLAPSFYSHVLNGILILIIIIMIIQNYSTLNKLDIYKKVKLLILFSILIGIHSLSHLGLESVYQWNPLKFL
jgi:hypothetical protein